MAMPAATDKPRSAGAKDKLPHFTSLATEEMDRARIWAAASLRAKLGQDVLTEERHKDSGSVLGKMKTAFGLSGGAVKSPSNSSTSALSTSSLPAAARVFGVPVERVLAEYPTVTGPYKLKIPEPAHSMLLFLRSEDKINAEGLFRVAGSAKRVTELQALYEANPKLALEEVQLPSGQMSVHDVSTCLKQYLRALPEPLLLFSFAKFALALDKLPATERIDAWQLYYLWLPSAHRNLTEALFRYLNRVARRQNRMDTTNLALVFTPAMLRNEAIADLQLHSFVVNALKVLIGHTDEIFRCTLWLAVRDNEALSSGTNLKRSGSQQQNIPLAADDAEAEAAFRASGLHKFISSSSASMKRAKKNLADIIKRGLSSTGPGPGAGTADSAGPDGSGTSALAAVAAVAVSAAQPGAAPPSTLDESNNNELPEANTTLVPTGKHKPVKQRSKSHLWKDVPKSIAFATIRGKGGNVSAAAMAYNDQDPDGTTSTNGDNDAFKGNATISASSSRSAKKRPSMFTVSSSVDNLATSASSSTANSGTSNASSNSEDALHNPTGDSNKPVTSPTAGSRSSAELSAASSLRRHNTISTAARPKIQIDTGSDIIVVSPAAGVDDEGEDQTTPTNAQVPLSATSQHSSSSGGIKRAATLRRGRPASDFVDPPQRPPSITTANAPMSSRPARNDSSDEEDDFDLPPPSAQIRHARWNSDIGDQPNQTRRASMLMEFDSLDAVVADMNREIS